MLTSLPDELVEDIVDRIASLNPRDATTALRAASFISHQWQRIINARLQRRPCLRVEAPHGAKALLQRLQLASKAQCPQESQADVLGGAVRWAHGLRKLQVLGQSQWRHRATASRRPPLLQPATLVGVLNHLEVAENLDTLMLVELPWVQGAFVGHVKPWPASLTTLILLTPMSASELFALLHNLGNLEHLVISSSNYEEVRAATFGWPNPVYTSPAPYRLCSFGIVCRTLAHWLKTGMPWGERDLRWIISGRSLERLTSAHIEFADDDDAVFIMQLLAEHAPLEELRLRAMQQSVICTCLAACPDLRRLHLSSIYGMGLRSISAAWKSIPKTLEHLSVDVWRLNGHGPWNRRSAGQLAACLDQLVVPARGMTLKTLGCMFGDPHFTYAAGHVETTLYEDMAKVALDEDPMDSLRASCAMAGVKLIPPSFNDGVVPPVDGSGWY